MNKPYIKTQRLAALFALGAVLFNYPLLALFNRAVMVAGVPLLYLYVFPRCSAAHWVKGVNASQCIHRRKRLRRTRSASG